MANAPRRAKVYFEIYYSRSTQEWVGSTTVYLSNGFHEHHQRTGKTQESARNAIFADIGSILVSAFDDVKREERGDE